MNVRLARSSRLAYQARTSGDAPTPPVDRRAGDRLFYMVACLAALAVVIVGFGYTAHVRAASARPDLSALVHAHATLMLGWYGIVLTQIGFVAARRTDVHRRFGWIGAAWALGMIVVGVWTVRVRVGMPFSFGLMVADPTSRYWLLVMLAAFATLVGAAVVMRRRREYHKRLMLLSCFSISVAGAVRVPVAGNPWLEFLTSGGFGGFFGLDLLLVYAVVAWDTWRHRRLHPAFVFGMMVIMLQDTLVSHAAGWIRLATRLFG